MNTLLPAIANAAFDRLKAVLDNLGTAPPQVLLLEGGSEAQRMDTLGKLLKFGKKLLKIFIDSL